MEPDLLFVGDSLFDADRQPILAAWDVGFNTQLVQPDLYQTPWTLYQKEASPLTTTLDPTALLLGPPPPPGLLFPQTPPSANDLIPALHEPQQSAVTWHHAATSCNPREPTQSTPALSTADSCCSEVEGSSSSSSSFSPSTTSSSPAPIPTPPKAPQAQVQAQAQARAKVKTVRRKATTPPKMTVPKTQQPSGTKRKQPPPPTTAAPKRTASEPKKISLPNQPRPQSPPAGKQTHKTIEEYKAHMRQWHNKIGKKYRNKLNEQFECLQAVLKVDESEDGSKHVQGPGGRTINKAKVLDLARQRIEALTKEREALMEERRELVKGLKEKGVAV